MENNNFFSIEFSAQLPIDIQPIIGRKYVLNGEDNSNFRMYIDAYDDSPTNSSIIDSYSNYTYAEGLIDLNGVITYDNEGHEILNTKKLNVAKYISKSDARLLVSDYKKFGGYAVQVIWNSAKNTNDKRPIQIKYFPIFKLGLNIDEFYNTTGYWYSWDWCQKQKYIPKLLPKFDGIYKNEDVEIYVVNRPSSDSFFAKPDWVSGLRYAQLEGELATSSYFHVLNGFQGGKMVNFNNGVPEDPEVKKNIKRELDKNFKGSNRNNQFFITFNNGKETAPEIIDMGIPELNQQYVYFSEECERKLIVAHKASPIIFASTKDGNGLSNAADEIESATALMYRKIINPNREVILDGLQYVFDFMNPDIRLDFADFETFGGDKRKDVGGNIPTDNNINNTNTNE